MGYSKQLFIRNDIEKGFICELCSDIMKQPCMLSDCNHIFCHECIKTWGKKINSCPKCHEQINGLKAPIPDYLEMYNKLELECHYGDCKQVLTIDNIEKHYESCSKNPDATGPCKDGCGCVMKMKEIASHNCIVYLKDQLHQKQQCVIQVEKDKSGIIKAYEIEMASLKQEVVKWRDQALNHCMYCSKYLGPKTDTKQVCGLCPKSKPQRSFFGFKKSNDESPYTSS